MSIDLNADVGEGYDDGPLLPLLTSVNIACGGHAGDPETMERTVRAAHLSGLAIGAHPGYPDRARFGRAPLNLELSEIERLVTDQVLLLQKIAADQGTGLTHVKPHGALYNQAAVDPALAAAIARAVRTVDPALRLIGLAGSHLVREALAAGLEASHEGFADRRYCRDGTLAARTQPGAVLEDPCQAAAQAVALARGEPISTLDGTSITLRVDTLCLHGDSPGAVATARALRQALEDAGIDVKALSAP